jgi:hypothetical protein
LNNRPPLSEGILFGVAGNLSAGWSNWLTQVFLGLRAWNQAFTTAATIDFGGIPAQNELASAGITVTGARVGDAVQVYPTANVSGVIFTGSVTANNTVLVYAKNFSAGAVNPVSQVFRIIVLQN